MSQRLSDYEQYLFGYQEKPQKGRYKLTPKGEFIVRLSCWLMDYTTEGVAKKTAVRLAEELWTTEGRLKRDA